MHGDTHFTLFYAKYGQDLQRQFFDHFLKGDDNGWDKQPKVLLNVRHPGEKFVAARRERVAARAHAVDQALSALRPRASTRRRPTDAATLTYETIERRRHLLDRRR